MLNVETEFKQAQAMARDLPAKRIPRLCSMALNKAARSVRTISVREAAKEMGIKSSAVRKLFGITFSVPKATVLESVVWVNEKQPAKLSAFKSVRQTRAGVKVKAWGKDKVYKGSFIATMRSGHRGVFTRATMAEKRAHRLPIDELFGPPIRYGFLHDRVQRMMETTGRDIFLREFSRLLKIEPGSFRTRG